MKGGEGEGSERKRREGKRREEKGREKQRKKHSKGTSKSSRCPEDITLGLNFPHNYL